MTAGLIDLREVSSTSGNSLPDLVELVQQLLGEPLLLVRRSYADELTFHFGIPQEYTLPKFGTRTRGSYILSARGSAWILKSSQPPILIADLPGGASHGFGRPITDTDLSPGSFASAGAVVVSATPFLLEPISSYALRVTLSDAAHLTFLPTPTDTDEENLPALSDWELFTPHGVLKVGPGKAWNYDTTTGRATDASK